MGLKANLVGTLSAGVLAAERILHGRRVIWDPARLKNVLVLEYMLPLGCCVHLTPLFEAIKRDRPEIVVTVATRGLGAKLLRHHPAIDHLIETPDALTDTLDAARVLRRELRRRGVRSDCVLTGGSDRRTRIAVLGALVGGSWRGGFTLLPQLYQRPLEYDWGRSLIDNNLLVAGLTGCGTEHREPSVYFSRVDIAVAEGLAREVDAGGRPMIVAVTQGSGGQSTGWHPDRFAEVLRYASEELGCAVAYVGTGEQDGAIQELRGLAGGVGVSLAGRTSVTELAALLAMSDGMVTLDTGTMHVGRGVGVPMVVLGPSWQKPLEWLPLGLPQVRILRGQDREGVPEGYRLDEIQVDSVKEALTDLLEACPPEAESRLGRVARRVSVVDHLAG